MAIFSITTEGGMQFTLGAIYQAVFNESTNTGQETLEDFSDSFDNEFYRSQAQPSSLQLIASSNYQAIFNETSNNDELADFSDGFDAEFLRDSELVASGSGVLNDDAFNDAFDDEF